MTDIRSLDDYISDMENKLAKLKEVRLLMTGQAPNSPAVLRPVKKTTRKPKGTPMKKKPARKPSALAGTVRRGTTTARVLEYVNSAESVSREGIIKHATVDPDSLGPLVHTLIKRGFMVRVSEGVFKKGPKTPRFLEPGEDPSVPSAPTVPPAPPPPAPAPLPSSS